MKCLSIVFVLGLVVAACTSPKEEKILPSACVCVKNAGTDKAILFMKNADKKALENNLQHLDSVFIEIKRCALQVNVITTTNSIRPPINEEDGERLLEKNCAQVTPFIKLYKKTLHKLGY